METHSNSDIKKTTSKYTKQNICFCIAIGLLLIAFAVAFSGKHFYRNKEANCNRIQKEVLQKIEELQQISIDTATFALSPQRDDVMLYVYDSSLVYWSSNAFAVEEVYDSAAFENGICKTKNAWLLSEVRTEGSRHYVLLSLLRYDYPYRNKYLRHVWQSDYRLSDGVRLTFTEGEYAITDKDHRFLFSLLFPEKMMVPNGYALMVAILLLISALYCCFFVRLFFTPETLNGQKKITTFLGQQLSIVLVLLGYLELFHIVKYIGDLQYAPLFTPNYYTRSVASASLGNWFVYAVLILITIFFVTEGIKRNFPILIKPKVLRNSVSIVLCLFAFVVSWQLTYWIVEHTENVIHFNNLPGFGVHNYAGFFILGCVHTAFFLVVYWLIGNMFLPSEEETASRNKTFYLWVFFLVFVSIESTVLINTVNRQREHEMRLMLGEKLTTRRDPLCEYRLNQLAEQIEQDTVITALINSGQPDEQSLTDYIRDAYFREDFPQYNQTFIVCTAEDEMILLPSNRKVNCFEYFSQFKQSAEKTEYSGIYYVRLKNGSDKYLLEVPLNICPQVFGNTPESEACECSEKVLFVELETKFGGLQTVTVPLLYDNRKDYYSQHTPYYTYARYHAGQLMMRYGNYPYPLQLPKSATFDDEAYKFITKNKYDHLVIRMPEGGLLVIGLPVPPMLNSVLAASLLLCFFSIQLICTLLLVIFPMEIKLLHHTLRTRFHASILCILFVSFGIIAAWVIRNMIIMSNNDNRTIIAEKSHILGDIFQDYITTHDDLTGIRTADPQLSALCVNNSRTFFTDINIYDVSGLLIATSRRQLFDDYLISRRIDRDAIQELQNNGKSFFMHNETIGRQSYLSAYTPLYGSSGDVVAYLNLPYFARQDEINQNLMWFIIGFVSIYFIVFVAAMFIVTLLLGYIVRPLNLIKDKMRVFRLRDKNEKIDWNTSDEVGELVKEYNRMVDELERNVERVARLERENTWKDVSRQMAHEIKNPLTPMKLSIQLLEKSWNDNSADFDNRLHRTVQTLVGQIDSLSMLSDSLSAFTKMSQQKLETIDIAKLIAETIDLHRNNTNVEFVFDAATTEQSFYAVVDQNQMRQVLINLYKNAIQAMETSTIKQIVTKLLVVADHIQIEITDSGCGMTPEVLSRIFDPYFTTKTKGSGLGLSIVKNIIESFGGKIEATSQEGVSTSFIITLKKATPDEQK